MPLLSKSPAKLARRKWAVRVFLTGLSCYAGAFFFDSLDILLLVGWGCELTAVVWYSSS